MIIVITVIIFVLGALLCFIKGKKIEGFRPKPLRKALEVLSNSSFNGYLVSTMVGFLGITTAIAFTNYHTEKQEQRWTIEFLEDVLLTELNTKRTLMQEALSGMDMMPDAKEETETKRTEGGELSIDVEEPSDPEKLFEAMKIYPISPVLSLDMLLTDSPYKYTISRYSYSALIDCKMNFVVQKARIDHSGSIQEMAEHLLKMYYDFERAYKVVEIELKYQNGEMNENHVYKEIDKLYDELRENKEAIVVSGSSPE